MNKIKDKHLEQLFEKDICEVKGVLGYKHLYDERPEFITKKISLYVRSLGENYNRALDIYDAFNFDILFGEYTYSKEIKTSTMYRESLIAYFEKYKKVKMEQILGLAFENIIMAIPEKEFRIKCNNTSVTTKEVMFFVKAITFKVLDEKEKRKSDHCTLHRNYFMTKKSKKDYKKVTGRAIGTHKIAHITKLLEKYDLIVIYPTYMKSNKYRLGVANVYHRISRNKA